MISYPNTHDEFITPLWVRSGYSLMRGAVALERMVAAAGAMGHRRLALTDVNNIYGATFFWKQASEKGIEPIIGAELADGDLTVVALVENQTGYENLCQLITLLHEDEGKKCGMRSAECGISAPHAHGEGDDCQSLTSNDAERQADSHGQTDVEAGLPFSVVRPRRGHDSSADVDRRDSAFRTPHSAFQDVVALQDGLHFLTDQDAVAEKLLSAGVSSSRVWLAVDPASQTHRQLGRLIECSRRRGVGLVACPAAMMLTGEDREVARLLTAIRTGRTFDNIEDDELPHPRALLRSDEQARREIEQSQELSFADAHGTASLGAVAIANNIALAQRCSQFKLLPRAPVFPDFDVPDGLSAAQYLRQLCEEGVWRRYGGEPPSGCEGRLEMELDRIVARGFAEYFLVVWDIVQYARRQGAPVAGRGSGASSLVAYLLGITNVCPLAFEIPFERFLNEYRTDFPDLDVDFCWRIRDDVIKYAFGRWGNGHVGMVSVHTAFQERSAVRETAKAMGVSSDQIAEDCELRIANCLHQKNAECGTCRTGRFRIPHFFPSGSPILPARSSACLM